MKHFHVIEMNVNNDYYIYYLWPLYNHFDTGYSAS
jgi:hypothetical protein